jgi:hypothetical protein
VSRLAVLLLAVAVGLGGIGLAKYLSLPGPSRIDLLLGRGGSSSEEVATRYLAAMLRADRGAVLWLMPTNREQPGPIDERIERYRAVGSGPLTVEHWRHSEASYLHGARISRHGSLFDEIAIQEFFAGRWYLIHFLPDPVP